MKFSKLIEEFRTIRDYKKETIEQEKVQEILQGGKEQKGIGEGQKVSVFFIEQGKEVYKKLSGKAGYFGKMMEAPHYLVITSKVFPGYLANSGYIMEQMRLKAWELGLGTCWLSIEDPEDIKKVLSIDSDEIVTAFAAIGYPYTGIFKKDISPKSSRLGIEELIYSEHWGKPSTVEELENRALANVFYYARYAPSWGNQQPWRFVLDKDKVILTLYQDQEEDMELDGGIVMLYFQRAANEEGIAGQWHIEDGESLRAPYGIPKEYRILGYFPL
ncbi:MAG: nitroreductase family protein [Thermotaleaceae bacterium]